jgi:hypothetical protein
MQDLMRGLSRTNLRELKMLSVRDGRRQKEDQIRGKEKFTYSLNKCFELPA